jgi:ribose transport system substrate-binding protein
MKRAIVVGAVLILVLAASQRIIKIFNRKAAVTVNIVSTERPQGNYIALIAKNQNRFWQAVKEGAKKAADEYGISITFEAPRTEAEIDKQLNMLGTALDKHPKAVILAALDSKLATPYLERAEQLNIPVIGFDSGVDSPIVKTTVATDNYAVGALAADKMAKAIGEKGEVGIVVHDARGKTGVDRRDGFIDTMKEKYPDIEVLPPRYGEADIDKSTQAAEDILMNYPDIKGVFGANEESTYGIINAVKALGKSGKIKIVGVDSGKVLTDAIREGIVEGAITQNPMDIGYKAIEAAVRAYEGEKNPEFIETELRWYDKSNIDSPSIQQFLYE